MVQIRLTAFGGLFFRTGSLILYLQRTCLFFALCPIYAQLPRVRAMLLEMLAICDNILDGSQDNDSIQAIRTRIQTLLDAQT